MAMTSNRDKVPHRSFLAEFIREFSVVLLVYFAEANYAFSFGWCGRCGTDSGGKKKRWTKNGWHKIEFILTHIRIWHQRSIEYLRIIYPQ